MKPSIILDELSLITAELAGNYPEIFRTLEEENFLLANSANLSVTENDLNSYLDSLKRIRDNYKRNHQDRLMIFPDKISSKKDF